MSFVDGIKSFSEPISKLIDALSNSIGRSFEPRHRKKMADAKVYEINKIAEAIRNNSDLPIVYKENEVTVDISDFDELRKRTGSRLAYQEMLKQENIEAIVDKSCIELDGKALESDEPISPEWMNRFINMAGEISTEEMQNIWAKVLAGEVIRPSSYSMQTLECLRNLSVRDAELFEKIANYVISERFVFGNSDLNQRFGITYNDILSLDDCGLINSSGMIILSHNVHVNPEVIFDFGQCILMATSQDKKDVKLSQFPLTRAGRELVSIARNKTFDEQYIACLIDEVMKKYPKVQWALHKVRNRQGDNIEYETSNMEIHVNG